MEDEEMPLEEAAHFEYRGEGAANMVFSYRGSNPRLIGKVLRIRKVSASAPKPKVEPSPPLSTTDSTEERQQDYPLLPTSESVDRSPSGESPEEPILSPEEQEVWKDWPEVARATSNADLVHEFTKRVMKPLLGDEFVDPGAVVPLPRPFLAAAGRGAHSARAAWRAAEGGLQGEGEGGGGGARAALVADHALLAHPSGDTTTPHPTICVEIKPKCGFLPSSVAISERNEVKRHVSRFELHQHLKLSLGEVDILSKYNPLDFFSGQPDRVLSAVSLLFETPQNNLRVFKDGKEIFGVHHERTGEEDKEKTNNKLVPQKLTGDEKSKILQQALTENDRESKIRLSGLEVELENFFNCPGGQPEKPGQRVKLLHSLVTEALLQTQVLERLLAAHKLDSEDIEGTISVYEKFLKFWGERESMTEGEREQFEEHRKEVQKFLVAATAKDCGLMVTFRLKEGEGGGGGGGGAKFRTIKCAETGEEFEFKVSFVDLDMKAFQKIPKYFKLDQKIVEYYNRHENSKRVS